MLLGYLKDFHNNNQKNNLEKLFNYSQKNSHLVSFSQKKLSDGDRFIIKLKEINSIAKAIEVLKDIKG